MSDLTAPTQRPEGTDAVVNDAHLHLFSRGYASRQATSEPPDFEIERYEQLRRRHRIGIGMVIGYQGESRFAGNNDYIRVLAERYRWIRPFAYIDPTVAPATVAALLDDYAGLSIYLPAEVEARSRRWLRDVATVSAERHALLSVNAVPGAHPALAELVDRHPELRVVLSHLGLPGVAPNPHSPELASLRKLVADGSIWVKISGLYATSAPSHNYPHPEADAWMDWLLENASVSQLVWGSDFSPALEHVSFRQSLDVHQLGVLSPTDRAEVMGGTLQRLLAVPGDADDQS